MHRMSQMNAGYLSNCLQIEFKCNRYRTIEHNVYVGFVVNIIVDLCATLLVGFAGNVASWNIVPLNFIFLVKFVWYAACGHYPRCKYVFYTKCNTARKLS